MARWEIEIDRERIRVRVQGRSTPVTPSQFRLLDTLARRPGVVLSRQQLIDALAPHGDRQCPRSIDSLVCRLKRALGPCGAAIRSVRGFGYALDVEGD